MTDHPPKIGYVLQFFPYLTETFVYREVEALREMGLDIVTLSNRTPPAEKISAESAYLMADTHYAFPLKRGPFVQAQLHWLLRKPQKYLSTLFSLLTQPKESVDNKKRTLGHFAAAAYLAYQVRDAGLQHLHAHFAVNAATMALVASRLLDIGFSWTAHQIFFTDQLLLPLKVREATFIAVISDYSRRYLAQFGNIDKMHIVRCGIRPTDFAATPLPARDGPPTLFSLARFDEKKGMPYLVEACALLKQRGRAFRCVIGGNGDQFERVQQLIAEKGLADCVRLTGRLDHGDVADYFVDCDLFALAAIVASDGDVDGIPVVLMESMANARPTISTDLSGIPELIESEVSGLLVPEKDAAALADAIERVLDDPDLAKRLAAGARETMETEFNLYLNAERLRDLFDKYR